MLDVVENALAEVAALVATYGLDVIGAVVILIVGWTVSGWVYKVIRRTLGRFERFDATLTGFFASLAKYVVLTFTVVAVLGQFGIQTASIIAALGAVGLAIGLALQGTLSNVAAGVMLLIFRPFKVGDFVEAGGHAGTVKALSLFTTEMATGDNVQIIVPNGKIWGGSVINYSLNATRRVDLAIGIGYEDDIDAAFKAVEEVIAADERALKDPAHLIAVSGLGDHSVDLVIRVWCKAADYWGLKFALTKAIKEKFDADGINIPYPQRTVHLFEHKAD